MIQYGRIRPVVMAPFLPLDGSDFHELRTGTKSLANVMTPDRLRWAFRKLRAENGHGPGPDGLTFADYTRADLTITVDELAEELANGDYRPGPVRPVAIPKAAGGFRTLMLPNVRDRVVSKALLSAIGRFVDRQFSPQSHGYRPNRSPISFFIHLELMIARTGLWVITADDVHQAYDSVPTGRVIESVGRMIGDGPLLDLAAVILRGQAGNSRQIGVTQGDPLSALAFNVYMHFAHDLALRMEGSNPPWLRYADNLVYLNQDVTRGNEFLNSVVLPLLRTAGLQLKGAPGVPADTNEGATVDILGLQLSQSRGRPRYRPLTLVTRLTEKLSVAHQHDDPRRYARSTVYGIIEQLGPALEFHSAEIVRRCRVALRAEGMDDLIHRNQYAAAVRVASARWQCRRAAAELGGLFPD